MPKLDLLKSETFADEITQIIEDAPLPGLAEEPRCKTTRAAVDTIAKTDIALSPLQKSALWLLAGELDRSHSISQSDDSPEGSFWHGIMHRRERDFGNAKYWFRRVRSHPAHIDLAKHIDAHQNELTSKLPLANLRDPESLPAHLVDLCQHAQNGHSEWVEDLQKICWWEWQLLFALSDAA